jgi:hypothetical protein
VEVGVQAILWWLIPLGATAAAIAWVGWRNRPRPPADTHDTLAEHQRFREAMDRETRRQPPSTGDPS